MNTALDRINGKIDKLFAEGRLNSQDHLDLEAERAKLWNDPLVDGHESQADFNDEAEAEADSGLSGREGIETMAYEKLFLILEDEDGNHQTEMLEDVSLDEAEAEAKDSLEDAPITYLYPAYYDRGWQPATHLDYVAKFERVNPSLSRSKEQIMKIKAGVTCKRGSRTLRVLDAVGHQSDLNIILVGLLEGIATLPTDGSYTSDDAVSSRLQWQVEQAPASLINPSL